MDSFSTVGTIQIHIYCVCVRVCCGCVAWLTCLGLQEQTHMLWSCGGKSFWWLLSSTSLLHRVVVIWLFWRQKRQSQSTSSTGTTRDGIGFGPTLADTNAPKQKTSEPVEVRVRLLPSVRSYQLECQYRNHRSQKKKKKESELIWFAVGPLPGTMSKAKSTAHEPTIHYLDSVLSDEEKRCAYGHQWRNFSISRSGRFRSKNKKRDAVDGKFFDGGSGSGSLQDFEKVCPFAHFIIVPINHNNSPYRAHI